MSTATPLQNTQHNSPLSAAMAANQKAWQQTNNEAFYSMLPGAYRMFYQNWVKQWLYWYDGYVPYIHGGSSGLLSTSIGTIIVNRCADQIFGGNIMFANARKPQLIEERDGKRIGKALDFISNDWMQRTDGKSVLKRCGKDALAGGFALLKLNKRDGELWLDELRADRFYVDKVGSEIRRVICLLSFYDNETDKSEDRYTLVEERRYESVGILGEEFPVVEYKMYKTGAPVQILVTTKDRDNYLKWENLPKEVRKAFKAQYGDMRLNEPMHMGGFTNLGVYLMLASDGVSAVPQIGLGESLLANVMTYLYEYDFYNTCFNTDLYLARGRIMVPKQMQGPNARGGLGNPEYGYGGINPRGLDDFIYTKYETGNNEGGKPDAIQFALRSAEWMQARDILMQSISTGIGLSVSTLASYVSDASNRTAREVSAEESATTLFVENKRRLFESPINAMLRDVLRFYGFIDDVEIRWTRAGMTNQTILVETLARAVEAGLISQKKAHHAFNFDDDEEQNDEDYALIQQERKDREPKGFDMPFESEGFADILDGDGGEIDENSPGQTE